MKHEMINQLNVTRFLATLLVVIYHFGQQAYPFNENFVFSIFANFGNAAVSYFFVLSGFVMTIAYNDKQPIALKRFWGSRFARLYPVYLFALIFYVIVSHSKVFHHSEFKQFSISMLLLQSWIPSFPTSMNSPGWFLSVLTFFYFLFPFLLSYLGRKETKKGLLISIIIWMFSFIVLLILRKTIYHGFPSRTHDLIYYNPLMHLNAYIVGIWGGIFWKRRQKSKHIPFLPIIGILFSVTFIFLVFAIKSTIISSYSCYHDGLLAPLFIVFILSLSSDRTVISSFLSRKAFVILGRASYSIYLLQTPIIILMHPLASQFKITDPSLFFYSYLFLLVSASLIIHYFYEEPLRRLITAKFKRQ